MKSYHCGMRFGRLTLIAKLPSVGNNSQWECVCECGNRAKVLTFCLGNGNTKSCGCLKSQLTGSRRRTHGLSRTRTYSTWMCMINRCYNARDKSYEDYGARGITVCERWRDSFVNFLADMGERPQGMTIDRIDNDGNYEKLNCQWANPDQQNNNRRNSRFVLYNGERLTVAQAARQANMRPKAFLRFIGESYSRKTCIA